MNSFLGFVFLRNTISPNWYRFGEFVFRAFASPMLFPEGLQNPSPSEQFKARFIISIHLSRAFAPVVPDRGGEWTLTSKKGPFRPRKKNHLLSEPFKARFKISIHLSRAF